MRGFEFAVHHHTTIDQQAGRSGQVDAGTQTDRRDHQVAFDAFTIGQLRLQAKLCAVQVGQYRPEVEPRPQPLQPRLYGRSGGRVQERWHDLLTRGHQVDFITAHNQVVGELAADQAGPEQQHPTFTRGSSPEAAIVFQIIDRIDHVQRIAFHRYPYGFCPPSQDQVAVRHRFVANPQALVPRVDAADTGMGANLGFQLLGHGTGFGHAQGVGILVLAKAGRQHRFGIGTTIICGDQQQRRFAIELAKFPSEVIARQARTDDHDRCSHA
ncbi:hypothetical protein D9M71_164180 [compost metagenome]